MGQVLATQWGTETRKIDFFDVKNDVEALLECVAEQEQALYRAHTAMDILQDHAEKGTQAMTDQDTDDDRTAGAEQQPPNTYTFQTAIVGVRFYEGASTLLAAEELRDLPPALVREPDNKYDKNAIAVYLDDTKVGHIPAPQAKILAPMLDAGRKVLDIKRRGVTGLVLTLEKKDAPD